MNFYFQGEPFLHSQLTEMISYASSKKIFTSTSTNAHYLNEETAQKVVQSGLDRLIISIDGVSQETYQQYRVGGKVDKVIAGTKEIIKQKQILKSKTPQIVFQFLVVRPNEHEISDVKKLANELGVDELVFKTAQVYDYENGNELIPENESYSRYRKRKDGKWELKNTLENHCWKMWHSAVVTWDGKVVPCCFDKDAQHQIGNLKEKSFRDVWQSEQYQKFRQSVLTGRKEVDICKNCSEGAFVTVKEI
jgi:radical SAM protein with 4Fe4S-binding SPASM domain